MQRRQLFGMQLYRQTKLLRGDEYPLDLLRRERQILAERIHRIDQPFGGQCREHLGADVLDVVVSAILVLRRQSVGGQTGAAHADRQLRGEPANDPQDLAFTGQIQTVAGLHLDRGHAVAHQAFQTLGGAGEQLVFARFTGGAHSAGDTAALSRDLGVADALQAFLEFAAAVATEHRVSVAVDQAGGDPRALQVVDRRVFARGQLIARADPLDVRTGRHDGRILDDRVDALRHGCDVAVLPEGFHPKSSSCSKSYRWQASSHRYL